MFFALPRRERWHQGFGPLWRRFWETYLESRGEAVLAAAPPHLAWRALVVANPDWYPDIAPDVRDALLTLAERALEADRFELRLAEELFARASSCGSPASPRRASRPSPSERRRGFGTGTSRAASSTATRSAARWSPPVGYDPSARDDFYANLAALLAGQGLVVLVPATAHRRACRARAREVAPRFVEVQEPPIRHLLHHVDGPRFSRRPGAPFAEGNDGPRVEVSRERHRDLNGGSTAKASPTS